MNTDFILKCHKDIKSGIHTHDGCFTKTEDSISLTYHVGRESKTVFLPTRLEAADFFKTHGAIYDYDISGNDVRMYDKAIITIPDHRNRPVQFERQVHLTWERFTLNSSEVKRIATQLEWGEVNKVIQISTILKRA